MGRPACQDGGPGQVDDGIGAPEFLLQLPARCVVQAFPVEIHDLVSLRNQLSHHGLSDQSAVSRYGNLHVCFLLGCLRWILIQRM